MSFNEFKSEWNRNWHEIDPINSNYITFHEYCEIQDVIAIIAALIFQQSNDDIKNHTIFTKILQGPKYKFITGSRFIRWLKEKLLSPPHHERLRIIIDDKVFTDISIDAFFPTYLEHINVIVRPLIQDLIKKLKETKQ